MSQYQLAAQKLNSYMKLPLAAKEMLSHRLIQQALETHKKPLVSSSFGKDSTVLIHLVMQHTRNFDITFTNTGVELKETLEFRDYLTKEWNLIVHTLKPEISFWQCVEKYGYPEWSRNSKTGDKREPKCCNYLKAKPFKKFLKEHDYDLNFVGLTGGEGRQRRWDYIRKGCAIYSSVQFGLDKCIPMIWWDQKDVWDYIAKNELPINSAYAKYGLDRTGCVPCTGHLYWEKSIAKTNPKLLAHILKDRYGQEQLVSVSSEVNKK